MATTLAPVASSERIATIDQLRGFAIFGILVVNTFYFFHPFFAQQIHEDASQLDHAAHFLVNFLFVSKFYTLFSFLFGLGMHIQMQRAEARDARFVPVYLRRLFVLAAFGLCHGTLLWIGDILTTYAVAGLLLLVFFRDRSPRILRVWAMVLIGGFLVLFGLMIGGLQAAKMAPAESGVWEEIEADFAAEARVIEDAIARDYEVYGSGSYAEITRERWADFTHLLTRVGLWMLPTVLGMFLLGLRAGRLGWFDPTAKNAARSRQWLRWALPLGLLLNLYVAATGFEQNRLGIDVLSWQTLLQVIALTVGGVLVALSWVALAILSSSSGRGQRMLAHLAPVGRMALSNYLLQSLVMSTLAYGYGLGMFGQVGSAKGLLFAVALFALQIPLSRWWLGRFRFGPAEWLWRTLTYGRVQPLRQTT